VAEYDAKNAVFDHDFPAQPKKRGRKSTLGRPVHLPDEILTCLHAINHISSFLAEDLSTTN
jgi:hypothetical protein